MSSADSADSAGSAGGGRYVDGTHAQNPNKRKKPNNDNDNDNDDDSSFDDETLFDDEEFEQTDELNLVGNVDINDDEDAVFEGRKRFKPLSSNDRRVNTEAMSNVIFKKFVIDQWLKILTSNIRCWKIALPDVLNAEFVSKQDLAIAGEFRIFLNPARRNNREVSSYNMSAGFNLPFSFNESAFCSASIPKKISEQKILNRLKLNILMPYAYEVQDFRTGNVLNASDLLKHKFLTNKDLDQIAARLESDIKAEFTRKVLTDEDIKKPLIRKLLAMAQMPFMFFPRTEPQSLFIENIKRSYLYTRKKIEFFDATNIDFKFKNIYTMLTPTQSFQIWYAATTFEFDINGIEKLQKQDFDAHTQKLKEEIKRFSDIQTGKDDVGYESTLYMQ